MEYKEYTHLDRSKWSHGPWDHEPDKIQFEDPDTKMPCLIVRNSLGNLCGYVGVTDGHPLFGRSYDDADINVHGGLTFSGFCAEGDKEHGICHTPEPGETDRVWWFGFDCAHLGDAMPYRANRFLSDHGTYRDVAYVKEEIAGLARQLQSMVA